MHLARHLIVSAVVLTSSSTIAEEVLAEDKRVQITPYVKGEGNEIIDFACEIPVIGSVRCTSPNHNVRVGAHHRLHVVVTSIKKDKCVEFTVRHAVDNKALYLPKEVCGNAPAKEIYNNDSDEVVDVYTMAKATNWLVSESFPVKGYYVITGP